jgi:hypothetical protein
MSTLLDVKQKSESDRGMLLSSINLTAKSVQIAVDWRAQIEAARPIDLRKLHRA